MAILLDSNARIVIQGITGSTGQMSAELMLKYNTKVLAGVTPGKGGQQVHGVPVYNSVKEARAVHDINASFIVVPPLFAKSAVLEALDNDIKLVLVFTENVPLHDSASMIAKAREKKAVLIGPASVGMISPGIGRIGPIGGLPEMVDKVYKKGSIGIISKSGGMTNETAWVIRQAGLGQSTVIGMGGEMLVGSTYADLLRLFEKDKETKAVVAFGELGGTYEDQIAEVLKNKEFTKPIAVFIGGKFAEKMPSGIQFGHAGAIIERGKGKPSEKIDKLRKAGALIATYHHEIGQVIRDAL
jgi:succinyl-CoA synthetase alpha subunit